MTDNPTDHGPHCDDYNQACRQCIADFAEWKRRDNPTDSVVTDAALEAGLAEAVKRRSVLSFDDLRAIYMKMSQASPPPLSDEVEWVPTCCAGEHECALNWGGPCRMKPGETFRTSNLRRASGAIMEAWGKLPPGDGLSIEQADILAIAALTACIWMGGTDE